MPMEIKVLLLFLVVSIIYYKLKENIVSISSSSLVNNYLKENNENMNLNICGTDINFIK